MAASSAVPTRTFGEFTAPGTRPLTGPEATQHRRTRWVRRIVLSMTMVILTGAAGLLVAAPSNAVGGDELASVCTPLAVMQPQSRGQGFEAFLSDGTFVPGAPGTETYPQSYSADESAGKDPSAWDDQGGKYAPSYSRYGMAGTDWTVFGMSPGCFDVDRYANFVPTTILSISKMWASLSMTAVGWAFSADPFGFLEESVGSVTKAVSAIAAAFLGLVAIGGAIYLFVSNSNGNRQGSFYKGLVWMMMIAGLFAWFQANPTLAATKVNELAASAMSTGFQAISSLPTGSSGKATMCTDAGQSSADSANAAAAACIQDALWLPLVYEPWAIGVVGNSGEAAGRYAPALLNAQYVGLDANGDVDEAGRSILKETDNWNGTKLVGGSGMLGGAAYEHDYVDKVPLVNFYATKVCRNYLGEGDSSKDFKSCWSLDGKKSSIRPGDEQVANSLFGGSFSTRMSAAFMSVGAGVLLNSTVIFAAGNVLWAKLGLWILMIFAPLYLLLGMFPGRSRVAAIKLGELLAGNLFKQVGWGLGLVLLAYLYTTILAAGKGLQSGVAGADWIFKVVTCAFVTLMFAAYAKPLMRAMSGMAAGNKDSGDAIRSVPGDVAKGSAKAAAMVGLAATGVGLGVAGAKAASASAGTKLSTFGAAKGALNGATRAVPGHSKWGSAIRGVNESGEMAQQKESRAIQRGLEGERQETFANTPHALAGLPVQRENRNQRTANAAAEAWNRKQLGDPPMPAQQGPNPAPLPEGGGGGTLALPQAADERGVVLSHTGDALLSDKFGHASNGLSGDAARKAMVAAAAADPTAVGALYANPANLDPYHQAAPAIASHMGAAVNQSVSAADLRAYQQEAIAAIAEHGLPDQITGIVHAGPNPVTAIPAAMSQDVAQMAPPTSPQQMVQGLNALAAHARATPAGSEVNVALNHLRQQYGSGQMTKNQFKVAQARVVDAIANFTPPTEWPDEGVEQ